MVPVQSQKGCILVIVNALKLNLMTEKILNEKAVVARSHSKYCLQTHKNTVKRLSRSAQMTNNTSVKKHCGIF